MRTSRKLRHHGIHTTQDHRDTIVYLVQVVSDAKIAEMELQHEVSNEVEHNDYQEYFHYLMENEGIQFPTCPEEAFHVFQ